MTFAQKLQEAMARTGTSAADLSQSTKVSRSAISQYLAGKHVPDRNRRKVLAAAMGLPPDSFEDGQPDPEPEPEGDGIWMLPEEAAKVMRTTAATVRLGLQQRVFPWGYAVRTSDGRWVYRINRRRFMDTELGVH